MGEKKPLKNLMQQGKLYRELPTQFWWWISRQKRGIHRGILMRMMGGFVNKAAHDPRCLPCFSRTKKRD